MKPLTRQVLLTLALLTAFVPAALASHYPLEAVPFIPDQEREALLKEKITDTQELLEAAKTEKQRKQLAKKTGIAEEVVLEYAQLCDLLRVRGIGPKMARLFRLSGVKTIEDLAKETPEALAPRIKETNATHMVSEILPDEGSLKDWIHQARSLGPFLK
ncbi:MAG: DUF4332 domain-containing protein [Deltaproteobacteria bacterium]|nr:DUF4332 domain-containing protein [Deltaproteobacteria bacterium]